MSRTINEEVLRGSTLWDTSIDDLQSFIKSYEMLSLSQKKLLNTIMDAHRLDDATYTDYNEDDLEIVVTTLTGHCKALDIEFDNATELYDIGWK